MEFASTVLAASQVLLVFDLAPGAGPVRFGYPVPVAALSRGIRCSQPQARLQWRRLQQRPDPVTQRVWVEFALTGAHGRVRLVSDRRGVGASAPEAGEVYRLAIQRSTAPNGDEVVRTEWRWHDGAVDWREQTTFGSATERDGTQYDSGERQTVESSGLSERALDVRIGAAAWRAARLLPPAKAPKFRGVRDRLVRLAKELTPLPGPRGRGDYGRRAGAMGGRRTQDRKDRPSNTVVTNLEFDTILGFAQLAMSVGGDASCTMWQRARESSRHLVDVDLHAGLGLPYCHGPDHRVARPEPGHVWWTGLLWTAGFTADDDLLFGVRRMVAGLLDALPAATNRIDGDAEIERDHRDRLRDLAWPLLQLEQWLRFAPEDVAAVTMADSLASRLWRRWDSELRVVRFGEGELRRGFYRERLWLVGGVLLPALRAHLRRSTDTPLGAVRRALEQRIEQQVMRGTDRVPVQCVLSPAGEVVSAPGADGGPELAMVLEGLPVTVLLRARQRANVRRALQRLVPADRGRWATDFSILARCRWWLR